jgi:hypothetical protein
MGTNTTPTVLVLLTVVRNVALCGMLLCVESCCVRNVAVCGMLLCAECCFVRNVAVCGMLLCAECCFVRNVVVCGMLLCAECCCVRNVVDKKKTSEKEHDKKIITYSTIQFCLNILLYNSMYYM